jgi:hypothetical protein
MRRVCVAWKKTVSDYILTQSSREHVDGSLGDELPDVTDSKLFRNFGKHVAVTRRWVSRPGEQLSASE